MQNASLLDEWLTHLTEHPRHLLVGMLVIASALFSLVGLIVALILYAILRIMHCSLPIALCLFSISIMCIGLSYGIDGISPAMVWNSGQQTWQRVLNGEFSQLLTTYGVLSGLPYSVFIGSTWLLVSKLNYGLEKELKRVASGRGQIGRRRLSPKQLNKALTQCENVTDANSTLLGVDNHNGQPIYLSDKDANLHTLVIGTTGSGKTVTLSNIIESAMRRRWPLIIVDGKGDVALSQQVQAQAKAQGIPFYGFSMVGESLKYNPIASGGYTSKKDRLIELRNWSEDHYRKLAEGYLQTVFKVLEKLNKDVDLWQLANYLEPDDLYLLAREQQNSEVIDLISTLEEKRKDIIGLVAEIQNITQSEIGHLFDCRQGEVLSLNKAIEQRGIVYFCLQPLAFPAYAETLGKLIINDIKAVVSKQLQKQDKTKLFTLFDEFSLFAGEQIINLINQGRSVGVHAVLATQSLSDITSKGGEALLGQVLNNCNNYIIQRQNNPEDAEVLANVIGTKDGYQVTSQVSTTSNTAPSGSVRVTKEFIVHPDEIKRLGVGEAVILNKQRFDVRYLKVRNENVV